ncbi:MAG: hypothetical protein ABJO67_11550 [Pseudoruegeria sp.]|uniref:hypothetical protein n=1 Tax=Roseobacteraceae TaxID=2854170 RepID=UPI003296B4F7
MKRPNIYNRPNKPLTIPVRKRREPEALTPMDTPEITTVDAATECHVTPDDVARRMVEYLGPQGDYYTLEPQAGTGQIVRALLESGHSENELLMIERHIKLASGLYKYGPTINRCFLEYTDDMRGKVHFPRIIMNPPFRTVRKHISAALELLDPCGHSDGATLVALVPITFKHDDAETMEVLGPDTFANAKVTTKIVRVSYS